MTVKIDELGVAFEEAAIGMAMVDFDGTFLRVNAALCELLACTEHELIGTTWQAITHPDDVPRGEYALAKALVGDARTFRLRKRYLRHDGKEVTALLSASVIRSEIGEPLCLFTQAVDITEQRRAEEGVSHLASIVESSDDAILSNTLDGTVLTWNQAAERMYGYAASEIVGLNIRTIVPSDRMAELAALLDSVSRGESVRNHKTLRLHKNKSLVAVSVTISPIRNELGQVERASVIARDITEQERIVAELDGTLAALESALDEARDAEGRSRRFLSDAAHHLRNPIAGIRGCVETILRGCPDAERERLLTEIGLQSARTSHLIDRLLRMSRLALGEPLLIERGDLVSLCQAVGERAASLAPHLLVVVTADEPQPLDFDVAAVREIMTNLLDNARRHALGRIEVTIGSHPGMVQVSVHDDGPGLQGSTPERAFEPFVSLDGSGSGLGLSVARALARAHGGDLTYEDGAFLVRLPRRISQPHRSENARESRGIQVRLSP